MHFTEEIALRKDPHARLKHVSAETKDILEELEKGYKAPEKTEVKKEVGFPNINIKKKMNYVNIFIHIYVFEYTFYEV